jgi:hypothetical protein
MSAKYKTSDELVPSKIFIGRKAALLNFWPQKDFFGFRMLLFAEKPAGNQSKKKQPPVDALQLST